MGAASAKPAPCRLLMAGHVPGEALRVCLDALGRPEVVDCRTGESCMQGGYVTHSMIRIPDGRPFLLRLQRHGLQIDAVTSLEALQGLSEAPGAPAEKYSGLIFLVDAEDVVRRDVGVSDYAREMLGSILDELGADRTTPVAVTVINCAGQAIAAIRSSLVEHLDLEELVGVSVHVVPAQDNGRAEIYEALDWISTQVER